MGALSALGKLGSVRIIVYTFLSAAFMWAAFNGRHRRYVYSGLSAFFASTVMLWLVIAAAVDDLIWVMHGINVAVCVWIGAWIIYYETSRWRRISADPAIPVGDRLRAWVRDRNGHARD